MPRLALFRMMTNLKLFATAGLIGAVAALNSASLFASPNEVKAEYKIFKNGILVGHVTERYARKGDRYEIISEAVADGALQMFIKDKVIATSTGQFGPGGLTPIRYEYRRPRNNSSDIASNFTWPATGDGTMTGTFGVTKVSLVVPRGTHDRLSMMYSLMHQPPRGADFKVSMCDGRNVQTYVYVKKDEFPLKTLAGDFQAVRYLRAPKAGEQKSELILAKDRDFLPVRILFEDKDGTVHDQTLIKLTTQ